MIKKRCTDCNVELDEGQQEAVDVLLKGVYPAKCFKCGKELEEY